MSNNQQIFEDWLDGKISEQQCAQLLQHNALWYQRMQDALIVQQDARSARFDDIPQFDGSSMFARQWQRSAPKRSWWPQVSLALSCCAMLISLSPARLQLDNGALTLRWQDPQASITAAVNAAVNEQQAAQQLWLTQQLNFQQQQSNSQLVMLKDYLQDELKREQRTDMLQLVEYLNQQRQSDWQYWQDNYQPMQASYRPEDNYYLRANTTGVEKP